jgi:hypothetical protein
MKKAYTSISLTLVVVIMTAVSNVALAVVATSTNYRIDRDSINFVGDLSTSTSYSLEDTGGEVGTGIGTSTNFLLNAGYQQNDGYITISTPADVTLLPSIDGAVGGQADGNTTWTVTTDNATGYALYLHASVAPAMQSGSASFANYSSGTSFAWSVGSSVSEFGFTPEGTAVASAYLDNGSSCGVGSSDTTDACWDSITTSNKMIATGAISNHPNGTGTVVKFRAQAGSSANQAAGTYVAVITATALAI